MDADTNEAEEYLIEELNTKDVPESELAQFEEVEVAVAEADTETTTSPLKLEAESALIRKFVRGEGELPDLYTKLEPEEEEEEEELAQEEAFVAKGEKSTTSAIARDDAATSVTQFNSAASGADGQRHAVDTTIDETVPQRQRSRNGAFASGGNVGGTCYPQRRRTVLGGALQGLMGEANLSFARGQIEMAEKICLEIIRQNPLAPEPFFTLAEIYETRDTDKHLNYLTIAAHLNPHERDLWKRIAEMHIAQGNLQLARSYYTRAIKVLPKDYDLRQRKARLFELMGDTNAAMFTYLKMIPHVPADEGELALRTAKSVAKHFHAIAKHQMALEAMEGAYRVCGQLFTLEDLNLYMEILILNKEYARVLSCLRERTELELETDRENNLEMIFFCVIPDSYVPDFRAKLCVSLIHLRAHHLLGYMMRNVHEHIPATEEHLEFYIDIAEALMQVHKYAEAIELLRPITDDGGSDLQCPAFVWLRQAECLRHLNRTNEAIESYARVVDVAPFCYEAKFTLSSLLKQQGRHIEAVKALEQAGECEGQPLNARLLYERCVMLQQIGEIEEFLELGCVLIGRQSIKLRNREEMLAAAKGGSFYNAEGLKVILQMRNITEDTETALQEYNKAPAEPTDLTIHDEYQLFLELVHTAYTHSKFPIIERLCFSMVTTKRFVGFHIELERIIILACYFNDDCGIAFSYLRELISKASNNVALWNLLSLFVQKGQDLRYHRYVRRLVERSPCARQMRLFLAHYHLHCCSYKYALNIYAPMLKEHQLRSGGEPMLALCIAVVFNQLSMQKKVLRKTAAVAQAIAFAFKYAELRGGTGSLVASECETKEACAAQQEIFYNIARIYHQSNMTHLAIAYYERALSVSHPLIEAHEEFLGLKQEIAFNLHLIYRASGNLKKARQYLYQYCVV